MEPRIFSFGAAGRTFECLLEKSDCEISMPICSRIASFVRLGDQVGATLAQKSSPSGPNCNFPVSVSKKSFQARQSCAKMLPKPSPSMELKKY